MKSNLILRLENVIYNTTYPLYEGCCHILKQFGYNKISFDDFFNKKQYNNYNCNEIIDALRKDGYINKDDPDGFCRLLKNYLLDHFSKLKFDIDLYSTLNGLANKRSLYLVSYLDDSFTTRIIGKLHITKLFKDIQIQDKNENVFIQIREKNYLSYDSSTIIEHSLNNSNHAKESGIETIIIGNCDKLGTHLVK